MARRIIWSRRAQNDRKEIFKYWNKRNKSNLYSKKLNRMYIETVEIVAIHPNTGRLTKRQNIRVKLLSHFAIIYKYSELELQVLSIFDTRQNPEKLDQIIEDY